MIEPPEDLTKVTQFLVLVGCNYLIFQNKFDYELQSLQKESNKNLFQILEIEAEGKSKLRKWLNMNFRIEMTDGRVLIGVFLCTDRDANVILGDYYHTIITSSVSQDLC